MKSQLFCRRKICVIWVSILMAILPFSSYSQKVLDEGIGQNAFVSVISTDRINNQFSLDLKQLPGFFERAYLLDLLFADPSIVINQTNISGSSLEVFSSLEHDPIQISNLLTGYRDMAVKAGKTLSADKKKELMKKYEKFR